MRKISLIILIIFLAGCKNEDGAESTAESKKYITQHVMQEGMDVKVPKSLVDDIESRFVPSEMYKSVENYKQSTGSLHIPRNLLTIKVYLTEKTKGILGKKNLELLFEAGGGEIDWKDYLANQNGSFNFSLKLEPDDIKSKIHVLFLPNTKNKKIHGEDLGVGCGKYVDVSDYFNKTMQSDGILLNNAQGRHVLSWGGTLFFARSIQGKFYVAQLTLRDSRYSQLLCEQGSEK